MDVRHEPLGEDAHGVMYWYLDLGPEGHTSLAGNALSIRPHMKAHATQQQVFPLNRHTSTLCRESGFGRDSAQHGLAM